MPRRTLSRRQWCLGDATMRIEGIRDPEPLRDYFYERMRRAHGRRARAEAGALQPAGPARASRKLRSAGGRHLVVGHSNTTPSLVRLLGGEPGPPIDEAGEYDRLYVVTIGKDDAASGALLRYGETYEPERD